MAISFFLFRFLAYRSICGFKRKRKRVSNWVSVTFRSGFTRGQVLPSVNWSVFVLVCVRQASLRSYKTIIRAEKERHYRVSLSGKMGSEKDSESPHSSVSGIPNPKCRAPGKRHGRISFHSLFHSKRGSRSAKTGAATPLSQLHNQQHQQQQLAPLVPPVVPSTPNPAPTNTTTDVPQGPATAQTSTPAEPLSSSQTSLGPPQSSSSTTSSASPPADFLECPLCLVPQPPEQLPELLGCSHRSCLCCLRQYLRIEITESRVHLSCPECSERLAPHQVADILGDAALLEKYEEFLLRRCLASDPDCRWCPAPDCG